MKRSACTIVISLIGLYTTVGQVRTVQWKNSPLKGEQVFPEAYINGNTEIENEINAFLRNTYLEHDDASRDSFYEYESVTPTANVCGIGISCLLYTSDAADD